MPHNFFDDLNEKQREAVLYCDGPSLIIAGAGSGKTRVLTYKIAYLLQNGYEPWSILALTFTNKAAREMNERIARLVGWDRAKYLWSGTFHSVFGRILRAECGLIGFSRDYTIYDTADARSLVKAIVREMGLDEKVYKPANILNKISEAKNRLILPEEYATDASIYKRDLHDNVGETRKVYEYYMKRCKMANAMDFDDLLLYTYLLFRNHEDIRLKYAGRFRYILVDEYQDTNFAQHRIITQLAAPDARICVVGDDAQSIYGFRGANIDNILRFNMQYPTTRTIKLECNYRSTQNIVNAANDIIAHNKNQIHKTVYTDNPIGERLHVFATYSDKEESLKTAAEINKLHRSKSIDYGEIALLYRTNAQSRSFEEALRSCSIPYRIYGGLSFYQRKEIKDIVAYLRLVNNPYDEEAFKRIINYPARGIGKTTQEKIQLAAFDHGISLWDAMTNISELLPGLNRNTLGKLQAFQTLIEDFRKDSEEKSLFDLSAHIVKESGIAADVQSEPSPENMSKQENIEELLNAIKTFETEQREEFGTEKVPLSQYLSQISLMTDADQQDDGAPKVTLMTVHAAKGLEFDAVFVTGLEDNLFPAASARYNPREMEEERRLFYVAVTRAKKICYLSYAKSRYRYGQPEFCNPSPFLEEIDDKYLDKDAATPAVRAASPRSFQTERSPLFSSTPAPSFRKISAARIPRSADEPRLESAGPFSIGGRVEHERFGLGTVVGIEGSGDSIKIKVEFQNAGTKNLLMKFAKLKALD